MHTILCVLVLALGFHCCYICKCIVQNYKYKHENVRFFSSSRFLIYIPLPLHTLNARRN